MTHAAVFLFDVDETLLDNDRITIDIGQFRAAEAAPDVAARYWEINEGLRMELGCADFRGAPSRHRAEHVDDAQFLGAAL